MARVELYKFLPIFNPHKVSTMPRDYHLDTIMCLGQQVSPKLTNGTYLELNTN